jgi:8-amino-7-oxononanoate synthase
MAMGADVRTFAHHDAAALTRAAADAAREGLAPIVVADGYCPGCGEVAPVARYAEIARQAGGRLVLDDTQALGILGAKPDSDNPFGYGGGGSLRWHGASGSHIVTCSSLAKGFGVPVAVLAGDRAIVDRFKRESETRLHCSPPTVAVIRGARGALLANQSRGDALRRHLLRLVARLRARLIGVGLTPAGALPFPVQTFVSASLNTAQLHDRLLGAGIVGLLTTTCRALSAGLTLLVTARHASAEIERAAGVIARAARGAFPRLGLDVERGSALSSIGVD